MSIETMSKCWRLEGMSVAQKMVLLCLADQANLDGQCWPSQRTIAKRCCLTDRAVRDAIKWLEQAGALRVEHRTGTSIMYSVTPEAYSAPTKEVRKEVPHPPGTTFRTPPEPASAPPGTTFRTPRNVVPPNPKESKENPKLEPKGEPLTPASGETASATWGAYSSAYLERYGTEPVRNAKVNAQIKQLVQRLGQEAPHVAAWYVGHPKAWYTQNMHSLDALVRDAEALRTQWATNRQITTTKARQIEQTATNANNADEAIRLFRQQQAARQGSA